MRRLAATAAAGAAGLVALMAASITPAQAAQNDATVSILHGVPGLTVDVYANGKELVPDFKPGTLTDPLTLPAGSYDLQVFATGDNPDTAKPAIKADNVQVPAGANATVVAHLDATGKPVLTPFVNDTAATAPGQARLTVRHTAAAPAVDVRAGGKVLFGDLTNPNQDTADVPAGDYTADVTLAGTDQVVIGPAKLALAEGTSTIVYAWGSAKDNNLKLAVQTIKGLHSAPAGVPGGEAGLAPESEGPATWALVLGAASAVGLAAAGTRMVAVRVRR